MIPPNCTGRLQLLDVSVNKPAKEFLYQKFHTWYAQSVCAQSEVKTAKEPIDLCMSVVKPLGVQWMLELYQDKTTHIS